MGGGGSVGHGSSSVGVESPGADRHAPIGGLAPLQRFRPDVQALRGLAVVLVVLYHAGIVAPGGFVGVDVFFVISGFVIGRRLVARLGRAGRGVLTEFYVHRARRILPALALTLVVVILAAPFLAPTGGVSQTSPTGIAAALFSANFYLYRNAGVGYFAPAAELNPLLHTWSLSVEEQFYFVIPALILGAWWVGRRRWSSVTTVRIAVGLLVVGSFLLSIRLSSVQGYVLHVQGARFAFYSPFTRAWEFAVGLALVLLPVRWLPRARLRWLGVVVGLAAIAFAGLTFSDTMVFPGWAATIPVLGAALVVYSGTRAGEPASAARGLRVPIWLGDLSYSWYLWHWPLIVFGLAFWPQAGVWPAVVAAGVSLLPAYWSRRALEVPLRAGPGTRVPSTVVLAIVCISAPILAAVVARPIERVANAAARDHFAALSNLGRVQAGDRPECNNPTPLGERPEGGCTWGGAGGPSVVLLGDSNAAQFSDTMIRAVDAVDGQLRIVTLRGCPVADVEFSLPPGVTDATTGEQCRRFISGTVDALVDDPPDVVVIATATDLYAYSDAVRLVDESTGAVAGDDGERAPIFERGLVRLMRRLRGAGSRVVVVDVVPKLYSWDVRECSNLAVIVDNGRCLPAEFSVTARPEPREGTALQHRAADRVGADTWGFEEGICPDGRCRPVRDGVFVWRDPGHISAQTARSLVPKATDLLRATLARPAPAGQ